MLKEVSLKDITKRLYPHKVYCYQSEIEKIKTFAQRPNFVDLCELWHNPEVRSVGPVMGDVFDGRIWRDFQAYEGVPFFASPKKFAVMFNVDWMQPFDHTMYSVGVLYLVLMNFPRCERFKRENVILVGIIPGLSEPQLKIYICYLSARRSVLTKYFPRPSASGRF